MADANTTTYAIVKPEVGASADTWGTKLNTDMDDVDALLTVLTTAGGTTAYTLTSGLSLAAYVSGQSFLIKMNATNTGASTLNVDSLGAKNITKNGTTALASGDLVSGTIYRVAYDGTQFQVVDGTALDATLTALAALQTTTVAPLINGLLFGCTLSNNGSDATNDIDIAAGTCADYTGAQVVTVAALTKQLDANWAAGTNQGMRYSGAAITNTTYHIYAAWKADGTQDIYADPSAVYATVLSHLQAETGGSGYLYLRRIGSILRESAAIVGFVQDGDLFMRKTGVRDVNATSSGTSAVSRTLSVPSGLRVGALIGASVVAGGSGEDLYISDLSQTDNAAATPSLTINTAASARMWAARIEVLTNTSAQVRSRQSVGGASETLAIYTHGWRDTRGRFA